MKVLSQCLKRLRFLLPLLYLFMILPLLVFGECDTTREICFSFGEILYVVVSFPALLIADLFSSGGVVYVFSVTTTVIISLILYFCLGFLIDFIYKRLT